MLLCKGDICHRSATENSKKIHFELNRGVPELHLQDTGREVSQSQRSRRHSPTPTHTIRSGVKPIRQGWTNTTD